MEGPLLQIEDLQVVFHTPLGQSKALRGVSFEVERGQVFGIVGESGCGKSMTARAILGLIPHPGEVVSGRILYNGEDLLQLNRKEIRKGIDGCGFESLKVLYSFSGPFFILKFFRIDDCEVPKGELLCFRRSFLMKTDLLKFFCCKGPVFFFSIEFGKDLQ